MDRQHSGEIRATGRMRSITKMGTAVMEDTEHDFLVIAASTVAHGGFEQAVHQGGDRFDVHFSTPFWDHHNAMCTPSSVIAGLPLRGRAATRPRLHGALRI